MNMPTEKKNNILLMSFFFFGILMIGLRAITTTYDNDLWWLLATGREILENGFPRINPWSIHDGLSTVIQQWLPSVILYVVYKSGGMITLKIMLSILILILVFVLYYLCHISSGSNFGGEFFLFLIGVALVSLSVYFSSRPQIYTMILYTCIVIILEKYRRSGNPKILYLLPLITFVHVNLHASMAPFDMFIIFLYLIPDIPSFIRKKGFTFDISFSVSDYDRKQLLIVFILAGAALLVNPYGIKGALYLVESYGAAGYGNYINEMKNSVMWSQYGIPDMCLIILGCIVIGKNGIHSVDFPLTVLFIVCIFLSIMHIRNEWLIALFSVPLIAKGLKGVSLYSEKFTVFREKVIVIPVGIILSVCFCFYVYQNVWITGIEGSDIDNINFPTATVNYLDSYCKENNIDSSELALCNNFNNGGFLEYYGYKVMMDPRPELWEPMITGKEEHYYQEYVDFACGKTNPKDIIEKYDFDFYLSPDGSNIEMYLSSLPEKYHVAEECNGYKLWENVK